MIAKTRNVASLFFCSLILCMSVVNLQAQDDFSEPKSETEESSSSSKGPKRKTNFEYIGAILVSNASLEVPNAGENGETITSSSSSTAFAFGAGMHIPLSSLSESTTLWLVPSVLLGIATSSDVSDGGLLVQVPVHVSFGYGALRKRNSQWGIEGGLGVTLRTALSSNSEGLTVNPSAMVDITYAPSGVYRLRFMTDILSTKHSDFLTSRQFSIGLVIGG